MAFCMPWESFLDFLAWILQYAIARLRIYSFTNFEMSSSSHCWFINFMSYSLYLFYSWIGGRMVPVQSPKPT